MLTPPIPIHQLGFVPDLPPNTPGAIVDMSGCVPTIGGMRTLPGLQLLIMPLAGGVLGIFTALTSAGAQFVFAGNVNHLFIRSGAVWVENDGGQTFNVSSGRWRFAQFLDDTIALDGVDAPQVSAAGGVFAPLGGNPPIGKYVAVTDPGGIAAVAFIFNTTAAPDGWYASAPGNDTVWTLNQIDQSAFGRLGATKGPITGASNLRQNMCAFKATSFYLGQYIGGQFVWQFQPISYQVGCASHEAIINVGDFLAWPGPDDFYQFDGSSLTAIPNALRQFYFRNLNQSFAYKVQGFYDNSQNVLLWSYPSVNVPTAFAGILDSYVSWNQKTGAWGAGTWGTDGVGNPVSIEAVLDQINQNQALTYGQFGILYKKYGGIPTGLLYGSASFGATPVINSAVVLSDGGTYQFSGPPQGKPFIQFGDIGDLEHYIQINLVKPQFSRYPSIGGAFPALPGARLKSFTREALGKQNETQGPAVLVPTDESDLTDNASFDIRETNRWHQFKIEFFSDAEINGIAVDASDEGVR
jgi:hypothetical protein